MHFLDCCGTIAGISLPLVAVLRALIVGANYSGEALLRAIRHNAALAYDVVGFVDDRFDVQRCRIDGVPVIGRCDDLPRLTEQHGIEEVLITSGDLSGREVRRLVDMGREHGFRVKVLPSYEQLLEERVAVHPRAVAIEDLLSRPSVEIDLTAVRGWLAGQVIMVTGSAGSIGSEICRQLLKLRSAAARPGRSLRDGPVLLGARAAAVDLEGQNRRVSRRPDRQRSA